MDLAYMATLPQEEFTERRQKVLAQMQTNSALLLFSEIENVVITTVIFLSVKIVTFGI